MRLIKAPKPRQVQVKLNKHSTRQEQLWSGEFGDEYIKRNLSPKLFSSSLALFSRILKSTSAVQSAMEFGANVGINIQALKVLLPEAKLAALEINSQAVKELRKIKDLRVFQQSMLDYKLKEKYDLVFTRCVLIHINPEKLPQAYDVLYKSAKRFICLAEYYNPRPMTVENYHGQTEALFKRDFTGEMLEKYKNLKLVDYGFVYHRDAMFPQDDVSWFLLERI